MSSAYLRLLIFLPVILIPDYASSILEFHLMYSAYKLSKQDDNIQPRHTFLPVFEPVHCSVLTVTLCNHCLVLTVASWPAYRFPGRQVRWSGIPISFRIFHSLLWSTVCGPTQHGSPKTDGSWWRVLKKCGLLEKGMANTSVFLPWEPHEQYEKAKR